MLSKYGNTEHSHCDYYDAWEGDGCGACDGCGDLVPLFLPAQQQMGEYTEAVAFTCEGTM